MLHFNLPKNILEVHWKELPLKKNQIKNVKKWKKEKKKNVAGTLFPYHLLIATNP